jgi:hypothetical protein
MMNSFKIVNLLMIIQTIDYDDDDNPKSKKKRSPLPPKQSNFLSIVII